MSFWETLWEVFHEDCLLLLPILFCTFFLIEYIEHRAGEKFAAALRRSRRTGPLWGALLGLVPQCSFSVSCAHLYNEGIVTAGTRVNSPPSAGRYRRYAGGRVSFHFG